MWLTAVSTVRAQSLAVSAADLQITPRFSLDLNTPRSGDEGNSFSQINAFFPLFQSSGRHLTFVSTTGRLDTQGNLGGNVALGHRLAVGNDMVLGGYLAYDVRDTEQNTFNQIGIGAELKGPQWETYVNGYVPVGTTSASVGEASSSGPTFLARAGTFERASVSDNTGLFTTTGTLTFSSTPLNDLGLTTITSPGTTTDSCTLP